MKDKLDELMEAEDYLSDDGQETGVATDSAPTSGSVRATCPKCGGSKRVVKDGGFHDRLCLDCNHMWDSTPPND